MSVRDWVLASILGFLVLAAIGAIVYIPSSPPAGARFTEFYILGLQGKAEGYPEELKVGEEGKVLLEIVNHEYQGMDYRLVVMIDGEKNNEIGTVVLDNEQKWEEVVSFIPNRVGDNQKVEFLLYKHGQTVVYRSAHLWIDVTQ